MITIILNSQEAEWLKEELNIMIEESTNATLSKGVIRSQFSRNVMRSLLGKLNEETDETPTQETSSF